MIEISPFSKIRVDFIVVSVDKIERRMGVKKFRMGRKGASANLAVLRIPSHHTNHRIVLAQPVQSHGDP
jgi:hypothetical protein